MTKNGSESAGSCGYWEASLPFSVTIRDQSVRFVLEKGRCEQKKDLASAFPSSYDAPETNGWRRIDTEVVRQIVLWLPPQKLKVLFTAAKKKKMWHATLFEVRGGCRTDGLMKKKYYPVNLLLRRSSTASTRRWSCSGAVD